MLLAVDAPPAQPVDLPLALMHTDEHGDRQDLVAASNADGLYSKPYGRVP